MNPGTGTRVLERRPAGRGRELHRRAGQLPRGVNYTLATNDFTASGGDGYPNYRSRMSTQDTLDQDLADHIAAAGGTISPAIQSRVHCTDSNPAAAPACPVGSP